MSTWRPIRKVPRWLQWVPKPILTLGSRLIWLGIFAVAGCGALCFVYFLISARYDLDEVEQLAAGTIYYDRSGKPIDDGSRSGRRLAKRSDIPDFLVKALLAREDARFFSHHGVDFRGLARATIRNIKDRDFTQGASTLTMQLSHNTFDIREKSIHRKLLEIAITLRIESRYSKDEIITHYLNRIYFGSGADGIEQAAQTYFGKPTRELSESECALIVGIIRGPHIFSPLRNLTKAIEQRDQTLSRMADAGFITAEEADQLKAQKVVLPENRRNTRRFSYAFKAVERELERVLEPEALELGGLHVYTTLAPSWQQRLEDDLASAVSEAESDKSWAHPKPESHQPGTETKYLQYAAVTAETKTGGVLALIEGRRFSHSRLDHSHTRRDLGSAAEPFIAAAASERGKLVLPGRPIQTGRQIGSDEVCRIAHRCGIKGPYADGEDVFRGAISATPKELATGLATIANAGKRPKLFLIREVREPSGKVIYRHKPDHTQAISAQAARDAATILKRDGSVRHFTGATASEREGWILRIGPTGSTAVWLGFDKPAAIGSEKKLDELLSDSVRRLGKE